MVVEESRLVTDEAKGFYASHGYVVIKGLFTPEEAAHYREHYMTMRHQGEHPGDFSGVNTTSPTRSRNIPA